MFPLDPENNNRIELDSALTFWYNKYRLNYR